MKATKSIGISDVVLRDAHQSLLATRMRIDDMLPIASKLDDIGYWSLETWGGAIFDSCIRYLGEDPWERIRELKKAMPKTPMQMLFRGQNILGYRHYADDVVEKFVERSAINGVDVFRVFDAMNDMRNIEHSMKMVRKFGKHAQGTLSYTQSPVHTLDTWVEMAKNIESMGADSICIKDMAGLLKPYDGYELVKALKENCSLRIHMHCHATTGLSTATALKCIEAGADNVDTSISSMSMTYGHSATESLVASLEGTEYDSGLDLKKLEEIATYFREVRKKYRKFEGSLRGVDSRILIAQVPGGMLTNMENQLRDQQAEEKFDEVLAEIPRVRKDLGYIPLVTPTSQIVGTQSVLNVLTGERYSNITKETAGVLKGEYGATPAPVNSELQQKILEGAEAITCRPADQIEPELESLRQELMEKTKERGITLTRGEGEIDDVLTYALFPQIGLKFLENRDNPDAFEPAPTGKESSAATTADGEEIYTVSVGGDSYSVTVNDGGDITGLAAVGGSVRSPTAAGSAPSGTSTGAGASNGEKIGAPLAGNIFKVNIKPGQTVSKGETILILEAMKMETNVSATRDGTVGDVSVAVGDAVKVGDTMLTLI